MFEETHIKTWWGKKWINFLSLFDKDDLKKNRGLEYTKNVVDIKINKNKILSKVSGRYKVPYEQTIIFKQFTISEKNKIKSILKNNKDLNLQLYINKFPEELYSIIKNNGIDLFPNSLEDLILKCNCVDLNKPCKHLIAVFYKLTEEIDKNPFLLFEFHGIKKSDLFSIDYNEDIFKYSSLNVKLLKERPKERNISNKKIESYLSLLQTHPSFYKEDFKKILLNTYDDISYKLNNNLMINEEIKYNMTDFKIHISFSKIRPKFYSNIDSKTIKSIFKKNISFESIFNVFHELNLSDFKEDSKYTSFLKQCLAFSYKLSILKAYLPEIFTINNNEFIINYTPNRTIKYVDDYLNYLSYIAPKDILLDENNNELNTYLATEFIVSMFLKEIINKYSKNFNDKLLNVFFKKKIFKVEKYFEKNIFLSIKNWLLPLFLKDSIFSILLFVEKINKRKYYLSMNIKNKINENVYTLKDFENSIVINQYKNELYNQLGIIASYSETISKLIRDKRDKILINLDELSELVIYSENDLKLLGIKIILNFKPNKIVVPKLLLRLSSQEDILDFEKINFNYTIKIDDIEITLNEFKRNFKNINGLVCFNEKNVLVTQENYFSILEKTKKQSTKNIIINILSKDYYGVPIIPDNKIKNFIDNLKKIPKLNIPNTLNGTLRPYQITGFNWLYNNLKKGFNVCIADDMGLGKTIQVITTILKLKEENNIKNQTLVICPTTIVGNWYKEFEKFSPSLKVHIFHGNNRELNDSDVIITTYGTLRRDSHKLSKKWSLIILDEAQNIKNPLTAQSKSVKHLNSIFKIAMTGTPIENKLLELWSIFDFLMPNFLGNKNYFLKNYAIPIEKQNNTEKQNKLKNIIEPFLLRRLKTDKNIINDLPEKNIYNEFIFLKEKQELLYKNVIKILDKNIYHSYGIERKGLILKLLTNLKQICNHPSNFTKEENYDIELSGKSERTIELVEKIVSKNEKVLIFTQYIEMAKILKKMLSIKNINSLFFYGGLSRKKRDFIVDNFQNNKNQKVMIVSLKAGGTGLNLIAANHVIHYDMWWNPAVENQATDRVFRIGQKKNVSVYRFITLGTFEEKINHMLEKKQKLAESIISPGEKWITSLSNKELQEFFKLF
ncbi:helicase [Tepiditoga spiralis]|uniref:Helicase n=1 Tax=Tepiditoga spiralis TaxID=2108365 RepID=A0A7G1GA76_9BACT|nr:DEAD/DEAH box helicase [Tepiditoga spiralis]BBE31967.1 helicase [Tepiditoga spiralis]